MHAQGAAPEGLLAGTSGGRINTGNTPSLAQLGLPATILRRHAAENIFSIFDWQHLGRKRFQIFGITTSTAKKIDALTKEWL